MTWLICVPLLPALALVVWTICLILKGAEYRRWEKRVEKVETKRRADKAEQEFLDADKERTIYRISR